MAVIGQLTVALGVKSSAFVSGLKKAERRLQAFANVAQQAARAAIAATAAIATPLVLAVKAASDMEEVVSKFDTVFGEFAQETRQWADQFGQAVGRSQQDLVSFLASMQDTFVPLGFARKEAAELSKQIAQLAIDLGSFNNVADAEVLRDLQSAIVGNNEAVRKYGIIITETSIKQELLNQGYVGNVQKATALEKVQARLTLITRATTDAQGDALKTAGSLANSVKALLASVSDLAVIVGQELLPVTAGLTTAMTKTVRGIVVFVKQNKRLIKGILVGTLAVGAFTAAVAALATVLFIITAHPIVALLTLLAAVIVVLAALIVNVTTATDAIDDLNGAMESMDEAQAAADFAQSLGDSLDGVAKSATKAQNGIESLRAAAATASFGPDLRAEAAALKKGIAQIDVVRRRAFAALRPLRKELSRSQLFGFSRKETIDRKLLRRDERALTAFVDNLAIKMRDLEDNLAVLKLVGVDVDAPPDVAGPPGADSRLPGALIKGTVGEFSARVSRRQGAQDRSALTTARESTITNQKLDQLMQIERDQFNRDPVVVIPGGG